MTYSDDSASPASQFTGDSNGKIFDLPDLLPNSPTTTERVVDTQSGFLVVIKRLGERLGLAVKRQMGTPPSSTIILTPDEALKLSRILGTSFGAEPSIEESLPEIPDKISRRKLAALQKAEREPNYTKGDPVPPLSSRSFLPESPGSFVKDNLPTVALAVIIFFGMGAAIGAAAMSFFSPPSKPMAAVSEDPLGKKNVDHFVRIFISNMLDFSPSTYRSSQIQAMAVMSPELVQKYWDETRFPLTKRQLRELPQDMTLMITELKQGEQSDSTVDAVIKAQLSDPKNPKLSTPVHLKLKLGLDAEGKIQVVDQEDLSSKLGSQ